MLLNSQLQNIVNTKHNRLDESCLHESDPKQLMDSSKYPRIAGYIRFNGTPHTPSFDPRCVRMWQGIYRAQEAGFQMYIGVIPCMDYMRPVIVMGVGYKYDANDIMHEGTKVVWVLERGGDFVEVDIYEDGMPMPLTRIDFGFQPTENNIKVRLNNIFGDSVIDVLSDADGDLKDVFLEMVEEPKPHTADPDYWFDRLELVGNIKAHAHRREAEITEKYTDLKMLVASRIQADGSKYMFKAKHLVDLPKDYADKLMPHLKGE